MENKAHIFKRWTIIMVLVVVALFTISELVTNETASEFAGAAGIVMLLIAIVMGIIWKQENNKANSEKRTGSNEG